jgi:dienelactone hydrolase
MTHILLFHSVLGLRPAVLEFAKQLKAAGHTVTTPDLYKGETFDDYEAGNKKWSAPGIPALLQQAQGLAQEIPGELVFAGFSNGAALAEFLAATQPNAKGALLMHGALPLEMLQVKAWPKHVPVQLHYNEQDPFRDPDNDAALKKAVEASGASFKEFLYPGNTHLFADSGTPDYVEKSAKLMMERVLHFLKEVR